MNRVRMPAADAAGALDRLQRHLDGLLAIAELAQRDTLCRVPDLWLAVGS